MSILFFFFVFYNLISSNYSSPWTVTASNTFWGLSMALLLNHTLIKCTINPYSNNPYSAHLNLSSAGALRSKILSGYDIPSVYTSTKTDLHLHFIKLWGLQISFLPCSQSSEMFPKEWFLLYQLSPWFFSLNIQTQLCSLISLLKSMLPKQVTIIWKLLPVPEESEPLFLTFGNLSAANRRNKNNWY